MKKLLLVCACILLNVGLYASPGAKALAEVQRTLKSIKEIDVNHDGKVNCIDYSLQFYQNYNGSARLVWNLWPSKPVTHLFVSVGGVMIEPQAYINRRTLIWFRMRDYWGNVYDPIYDEDVTDHVDEITNNRYITSTYVDVYKD